MTSHEQTLALIADELRALAQNNLQYTDDPYQIQRNRRVLELAAELLALIDPRPAQDIQQIFWEHLDYVTPLVVADTAVLDPEGKILLIRRADNGLWAMPGGACDVGETPAQAAAREVWEESGYVVEITRLLGIFDSRITDSVSGRHLYILLFAGTPVGGEPTLSHETTDLGWFTWDTIPWDSLSPGQSQRLQYAMQWWLNPSTKPYFDWAPWQPPVT